MAAIQKAAEKLGIRSPRSGQAVVVLLVHLVSPCCSGGVGCDLGLWRTSPME